MIKLDPPKNIRKLRKRPNPMNEIATLKVLLDKIKTPDPITGPDGHGKIAPHRGAIHGSAFGLAIIRCRGACKERASA